MEASPAYVDALKMLARRELSEAQVRARLIRRGHDADRIEEAIVRLRQERAIDDSRVAHAIARSAASVKRRGRLRVQREIESAGISCAAARQAVDEVFGELDESALVEAALARRLRGRVGIEDERHFQRLYRYLIGQGFEAHTIVRVLKARSVK